MRGGGGPREQMLQEHGGLLYCTSSICTAKKRHKTPEGARDLREAANSARACTRGWTPGHTANITAVMNIEEFIQSEDYVIDES